MNRSELLTKLRSLRDVIAAEAQRGLDTTARSAAYRGASDALLDDDLDAARWLLAAQRLSTQPQMRSGPAPIVSLAEFRRQRASGS